MSAQQEFFMALKQALITKGYSVYDNGLPPESTPYPFVYLAGSTVDSYGLAKAQEAGYITQIVQVWGRAEMRGTISNICQAVLETARTLTESTNYAFALQSDSQQQILNDNTTKTPLMQGYSSIRVFFSRK